MIPDPLAAFCWAPRASLVASPFSLRESIKQVEPGGTRQAARRSKLSANQPNINLGAQTDNAMRVYVSKFLKIMRERIENALRSARDC